MAQLTGWIAMSHGPQLMVKPDQWDVLHNRRGNSLPIRGDLLNETIEVKWAKWQRCMDAIEALRLKLEAWAPDVLVMVADDQHENILDHTMPPFTIYTGGDMEASVSLNYFKEPKSENRTAYKADQALARALLDDLMEQDFDPAYSRLLTYEGGMGHAFARILKFLTPAANIPVVPIMVNTYFPPVPSARRCVAFGHALSAAIRALPGDSKVVVIGSGGLSHTMIDEALDAAVLKAIQTNDLDYLKAMPTSIFREGTSEILNWLVTAASADRPAQVIDYVPCYRTPTGVGCAMGFAYWDGDVAQ